MTVPTKMPVQGDIMESVLLKGDLAKLTPEERVRYYGEVCRSLGLNPLTKPFEFITLNGKLQLYALRACADQLRKVNGVTLEIVSQEVAHDILTVHVRARLPDGRADEDMGAVPFPDTLKGEARANATLKAVTKAKRRATLSICGLGWLDETEVESIPAAARRPVAAPNAMIDHDTKTGEIIDPPRQSASAVTAASSAISPQPQDGAAELSDAELLADQSLADAAKQGKVALRTAWQNLEKHEQNALKVRLDAVHKPVAEFADAKEGV